MRVRHGTKVLARISDGKEGRVVDEKVIDIDEIGVYMAIWSATHGGISGSVDWRDDAGQRLSATPRLNWELVDPADELTGDQLCDCPTCLAGGAP